MARYDRIGVGYTTTRREDPNLRGVILDALGSARSVVNVGAGTGSYEPTDRFVAAVEPSAVMIGQRTDAAPAALASAGALPIRTDAVDAGMAVITIHHWDDELEAGVRELRRVTRGPIVIVTYDAEVCGAMWLPQDYFPEAAELDRATFPRIDALAGMLGGAVQVLPVPTSRDTPDWTFGSFWAHPERVLDPTARRATSAFSRQPDDVVDRVVREVRRDLESGDWDRHHGHLRDLGEYDVGLRVLVATP